MWLKLTQIAAFVSCYSADTSGSDQGKWFVLERVCVCVSVWV